jgi:hypothetical protein
VDKPVLIDVQKLERDLTKMGWGATEISAVWHTLWDYSGEYLTAYDERIEKYKTKQPKNNRLISL